MQKIIQMWLNQQAENQTRKQNGCTGNDRKQHAPYTPHVKAGRNYKEK